jgi:nucleotide-binding universal stress UspA family protein
MSAKAVAGIVVGADGSPSSLNAVRYAAREAQWLDTTLEVVHVAPDYVPVAATRPLVPDDLESIGRTILARATALAIESAPGRSVTPLLRAGPTVPTLVDLAAGARMIVLGHETTSPVRRVFTGAVTMGVTARATCPVVSVPEEWDPGTRHGCVVVGVKASARAAELLARAFAEASLREARLVILHSWELPSAYDDAIAERTHPEGWTHQTIESIDSLLRDCRASRPEVPVEIQVVHDQPAPALVEASAGADLVLLVRRAHGFPAAAHLGGTARAVLREAHCPVEVVAPRNVATEVGGLVLEEAGAPRK